jgi:hypothetical protein
MLILRENTWKGKQSKKKRKKKKGPDIYEN